MRTTSRCGTIRWRSHARMNNPLEAIGNLVFLAKNQAEDASKARRLMEAVEYQLARLGEITRRSLSFYREEAEPKAFDLVDIAEAAIRLHLHGLPRPSRCDQRIPEGRCGEWPRGRTSSSAIKSLFKRAACSPRERGDISAADSRRWGTNSLHHRRQWSRDPDSVAERSVPALCNGKKRRHRARTVALEANHG